MLGYLRERMTNGETLKPNSPLVSTGYGYRLKGWGKLDGNTARFLTTAVISKAVRPVIWSVIKVRPYALRAYFDSQLLIAESHGCMTHAYRQFFMGHKGDMEARYTTNKGRLTEQMTEDMRRSYERSQAFLSTDVTQNSDTDRRKMLVEMWRQQAKMWRQQAKMWRQQAKMWRQQAKMYGLDPDAMLASGLLNGAPDAPLPAATAVTFVQNGGTGNTTASNQAPKTAGQRPPVARDVSAAVQAARTAVEDGKAQDAKRSLFESRIADGEAELLAGTAEGWDLVKDLPGERFLIRRKIPRS